MCPLCSSTRATPLKIITTARRSVHTLMGSKEVFSTKTRPFILGLILRERGRQCQNYVLPGAALMQLPPRKLLSPAWEIVTRSPPIRLPVPNTLRIEWHHHHEGRAIVSTKTCPAPAASNTSAQLETVAPVVNTSSTSSMFSPTIRRG